MAFPDAGNKLSAHNGLKTYFSKPPILGPALKLFMTGPILQLNHVALASFYSRITFLRSK